MSVQCQLCHLILPHQIRIHFADWSGLSV